MLEKALVTTVRTSAVAPWADRRDIRELAERLRTMMPGAQRLEPAEAFALAQCAVAHGLDPFNGELWFLKDKHGKPLGLMAGIKGHRRSAHRQMKEEGGGNYWPEFQQLDQDEKGSLGIPTDALAYRCRIRDTNTVNSYVSEIERLLAAGLPWKVVSEIAGSKPYTEGIGYAQKNERSRMTLVQRAMKRAEADALKRRFDLPFGIGVGLSGDTDVIEGEFVIGEEDDAPRISEEALEKGRAILRGDEEDANWDASLASNDPQASKSRIDRPAPPEVVRRWLRKQAFWTQGEADDWRDAKRQPDDEQEPPLDILIQRVAALMGKALARPDAGNTDLERHSVLGYIFGVDSTKLLTLREAESCAKWLEAQKLAFIPSGVASEECRLMLKAAMEEAGQQELPWDESDKDYLAAIAEARTG